MVSFPSYVLIPMPHGMELTPPSLNLKELLETIMTFSRDDGKCNLLEVALEVQENPFREMFGEN